MDKANLYGMIALIGCDAPKAAPGDYAGEDGLLYCGKCRTRKQYRLPKELFGGCQKIVPVSCRCAREAYSAELNERKRREDTEAVRRLRSASLMDAMSEKCTFDGWVKTASNQRQLSVARRYADSFPEMLEKNRGLLFYGPPGTGKTFAAACIANALLDKGVPVLMTSFVKLNATAFTEADSDTVSRMDRAKLLIIDDLGAERGSEFSLERVYNVIDSRVRARLPMILTTNMSLKQMQETDDTRCWRIYDRVFQSCFPVEFSGQSFRKWKAQTMYNEMNELFGSE